MMETARWIDLRTTALEWKGQALANAFQVMSPFLFTYKDLGRKYHQILVHLNGWTCACETHVPP